MKFLEKRRVLLVSGGGIAAYKAPMIVRDLTRAGAEVRCVLTHAATSFVAPMALQAVSGRKVSMTLLDPEHESEIGHIELARWADVVLVAPATANLIARMAAGMANDLATTLLLATRAPVVLAPAMNTQMLEHPATVRNMETLRGWGHTIVAPSSGDLACGEVGRGRQPDPEVLVEALGRRLAPKPLEGQRVTVSAGPTRAHLDPVRFISNPSSGKMGVAMARAARWLGAEVTLVAGPGVAVPEAYDIQQLVRVDSAREMADAVLGSLGAQDWLVMAAAVGDWEVEEPLTEKRKKHPGDSAETWTLTLSRTTDILLEATSRRAGMDPASGPRIIGFAAETHDMQAHARAKLARKGCDAILGNWVRSAHGDTFGADDVKLTAFTSDSEETFGPAPKFDVALEVFAHLTHAFDTRAGERTPSAAPTAEATTDEETS